MSETQFRHILKLAIMLLLLLSLALPVWALNDAEINVTVPAEHTVTVICGSGGKVTVGQSDYTGTNSFTVARHGKFMLTASPEPEHELVSVSSESICRMSFDKNSATVEKVSNDTVIEVLFRAAERVNEPVRILVPVTSQTNRMAAEAVITGDEASVTLGDAELGELLGSDDPGTVTVDISHLGVNISSVDLKASTVRAIAERTDAGPEKMSGMNVVMPGSTVAFDSAALAAISEQAHDGDVTLHVEEIKAESLNTAQQAAIEDLSDNELVVTVTLKNGDTAIRDFKGGGVEIELPYEPRENEDTDTISVWFVSEDGSMEQIPCRYKSGVVAFTVFHFSEYLILPGTLSDDGALWWLISILVAVTALVIFAPVYFAIKAKRKRSAKP